MQNSNGFSTALTLTNQSRYKSACEEKSEQNAMNIDNTEEEWNDLAKAEAAALQKQETETHEIHDLLLETQQDNGKRKRLDVYSSDFNQTTQPPTLTIEELLWIVNWFTAKRIETYKQIKNCKKKSDSLAKLLEHTTNGTLPNNLTQIIPYDQWPHEISTEHKKSLIDNEQNLITTLQHTLLASRLDVYTNIVKTLNETITLSLLPKTILSTLLIDLTENITPKQNWTIEYLYQNTSIQNQINLMTTQTTKLIDDLNQRNQPQRSLPQKPSTNNNTSSDNSHPEELTNQLAKLKLDIENLRKDNGNLTTLLSETQRSTTTTNNTYDNSSRIKTAKNEYEDGIDKKNPSRGRGTGHSEYALQSPATTQHNNYRHNTPRSQSPYTRSQSPYTRGENNYHQQTASPRGGRDKGRGGRGGRSYRGRPENHYENHYEHHKQEDRPYDNDYNRKSRYGNN